MNSTLQRSESCANASLLSFDQTMIFLSLEVPVSMDGQMESEQTVSALKSSWFAEACDKWVCRHHSYQL